MACSGHICDNPALNELVLEIIPGVIPDEVVAQFEDLLRAATGMELEEALEKRKDLQERLKTVSEEIRREELVPRQEKQIEG